ncbi:single-stranded DNA-binding protein [Lewinella sp. 4G2]|uniref:single-stranded DNA-binding protein n=1 Tax=Lewinella sp. 4G2 TaxID=1803372 RepID=UPI0007B4E390|nr:single-stranded DNA-binding protein [Lewinella sp. 4G2]OAV45028.1 hypothetical protein A3850_011255 [Lewinella sp. 4G2]
MNQLTLIGQVRKPMTYHCTEGGRDMLRFAVATGGTETASNSKAGTTYYPALTEHHCIAWGPAALDLHAHLGKGDRLMINGELHYRTHRNRKGDLQRFAEIYVRGYTYL